MQVQLLLPFILPVLTSCHASTASENLPDSVLPRIGRVEDIPLPDGYTRVQAGNASFGSWLRRVNIKEDRRVYLYNGQLKSNQQAQYAVLDIPVGSKNLQQCADAVMRLRAEYLFEQKRFSEISFADNAGRKYVCPAQPDRQRFERYLEEVFAWCGTASLEKRLRRVQAMNDVEPGDVLIRGGFPGHAVIVMDVACNAAGKKLYLLAQSYMPAQDIHVLKNPTDAGISPWYEADDKLLIVSPEWTFSPEELKRW